MSAKTTTVFRFEFSDGRGIYHYDANKPAEDTRTFLKTDFTHQPLPGNDKTLDAHLQAVTSKDANLNPLFHMGEYGFNSVQQVYKWFTCDELSIISKHPVTVVSYELPQAAVMTGDSQCLISPMIPLQLFVKEKMTVPEFMQKFPKV